MDGTILWESQSERHKVTYDPYKYDTFVTVSDKEPNDKAYFVRMVAYGTNWDGLRAVSFSRCYGDSAGGEGIKNGLKINELG